MIPTKQEVLQLLPPFQGISVLVKHEQDVTDIIKQIEKAHKSFGKYYDKIALCFDDDNVKRICDDLYFFCRENMPYKEETEKSQTTKPPQGLLHGFVDCKGFSSFVGGCLDSLNRYGKKISWCYRFASYRVGDRSPHHVFIVVNPGRDEIWIDPVPGAETKTPIWILDKKISCPMALISYISGIFNNGKVVDASQLTQFPAGSYWDVRTGTWHFPTGKVGDVASTLLNLGQSSVQTTASLIPGGGAVANTGISLINSITSLFGGSSSTAYTSLPQMFPIPPSPSASQIMALLNAVHAHFDPQLSPPVGTSPVPTSGDTNDWRPAVQQYEQKLTQLYQSLSGGVLPSVPSTTSTGSGITSFLTSNPALVLILALGGFLAYKALSKKDHRTAGVGGTGSLVPLLLLAAVAYFLLKKKTTPATPALLPAGQTTLAQMVNNLFSPASTIPQPSASNTVALTQPVNVVTPPTPDLTTQSLQPSSVPMIDMATYADVINPAPIIPDVSALVAV